jgi:hypothetical protein
MYILISHLGFSLNSYLSRMILIKYHLNIHCHKTCHAHCIGNISSGNQHLHANYGNFNLSHSILIQGRAHRRWKGWFAKFMGGVRRDLQRWFCKSLLPPPLSALLDQHRVTQIEVSIVCMERLVSTWYVAHCIGGKVLILITCKESSATYFEVHNFKVSCVLSYYPT